MTVQSVTPQCVDTSVTRRMAMHLVATLQREGHDCYITLDAHGVPTVNIIQPNPVRHVTIEFARGEPQ